MIECLKASGILKYQTSSKKTC